MYIYYCLVISSNISVNGRFLKYMNMLVVLLNGIEFPPLHLLDLVI